MSNSTNRNTSPVVVALLLAIALGVAALIAVLALGPGGPDDLGPGGPDDLGPGGPEPQKPYPPPKAVNNPVRFKETLQQGKTYRATLKVGFNVRATDKDWGIRTVATLVYAAEMEIERRITSNDGKTVIEERRFVESRNTKILTEVEDVTIEIGPAGVLLLAGLEGFAPGAGSAVVAAKPIIEAVVQSGADEVFRDRTTQVFAHVDSLEGKTVRITYIDGEGIKSVEPVDCELNESERAFVQASAVLSDYYVMPQLDIKVGGTWSVDGGQFGGFIDPTLRGVPSGQIVVVRDSNSSTGGKHYATLRIQSGYVTIDESDNRTERIGTFTPRGTLTYSIDDCMVARAEMQGRMVIDRVSRDHILFEARFKAQPLIVVKYNCSIQ